MTDPEVLLPSIYFFPERCVFILQVPPPTPSLRYRGPPLPLFLFFVKFTDGRVNTVLYKRQKKKKVSKGYNFLKITVLKEMV